MPAKPSGNNEMDSFKKFMLDILKWVITTVIAGIAGFVFKTQLDIVHIKRDIYDIRTYELTRIEGKVDAINKTLEKMSK